MTEKTKSTEEMMYEHASPELKAAVALSQKASMLEKEARQRVVEAERALEVANKALLSAVEQRVAATEAFELIIAREAGGVRPREEPREF